jgi:hypothetical protein
VAPLPYFGNRTGQEPAAGQAASIDRGQSGQSLSDAGQDLTGPEARYLAAIAAELGQGGERAPRGADGQDDQSKQSFGSLPAGFAEGDAGVPDSLVRHLAAMDPSNPGAIIAAALADVPQEARAWVERTLAVGAMLELSCAEALGHLRAGNGVRGA